MIGTFITAVLVLSFMIFVHELGHFFAAKKSGVGVEKFSIGFGPRIYSVKKGETEYILAAVPFGGYVKMVGDDPDQEVEDGEKSFLEKPVWKRMAIVLAGPAANLLSAILIMYGVYLAGVPVLKPVVGTVQEGSAAAEAGLAGGDVFLSIDGRPVALWEELTEVVHSSPGRELHFEILREGEAVNFAITPRETKTKNLFGEEISVGLIGITPADEFLTMRYGPVESLQNSFGWTANMIRLTMLSIVKMFQGVLSTKELGGPIMIVQAAGKSAEQGILNLLHFVAYISVALGLFNLFPIPVLDGGHLLFFAIEGVRGRPVSIKVREICQQVGLVLLIGLMVYATRNDILRILGW
jgi:regulator of sigma E protease